MEIGIGWCARGVWRHTLLLPRVRRLFEGFPVSCQKSDHGVTLP